MEQHAANQPYGQSPLGMQIQGQMGMQQGGVPPTEFPILAGANGSPYQTGMQHPQYYVLSSQQQPQQQQQQPVVLVGKPLAGGTSSVQPQYAVLPQGLAQQPAAAGFSMPQLVSLPGAPSLRPQFTSFPAASGGGYPQLTGLPAAMPAGVFQPQPPPPQQSMQAMAQQQQMSFPAGLQQQMGMPQHIHTLPPIAAPSRNMTVKSEPNEDRPSSSHSANTSAGGLGSDGSPQVGSGGTPGSSGGNKSRYRGVSYDRKKAKWRVQIKVAALGKSGVSVGYFDTEEAAARAYDRAAIGLLGLDNPNLQTNFELGDYAEDPIPRLTGKTREEVKTTLKSERIKVSRYACRPIACQLQNRVRTFLPCTLLAIDAACMNFDSTVVLNLR